MKNLLITALVLFYSLYLYASDPLPRIEAGDIEGAQIKSTQVFKGESLFGFMNGGAELYLEYGFDSMAVQKITINSKDFQAIVYKMSDSAGAYGIHSVTRHQAHALDQEDAFTYSTEYSIQKAVGRYFIVVSGTNKNGECNVIIDKIIEKLAKYNDKQADFEFPMIYRDKVFESVSKGMIYCRGILGVQNSAATIEELFEGLNDFEVFIIPKIDTSGFTLIRLKEISDMRNLYNNISKKRSEEHKKESSSQEVLTNCVVEVGPQLLLLIESNLPKDKLQPYLDAAKAK